MEEWRGLVTLAALGFTGADRDWIQKHGGATYLVEHGREHIFAHLAENNRASFFCLDDALEHATHVESFVASGGIIAGLTSKDELGRLSNLPKAPLCAFVRGSLDDLKRTPTIAIVGTRSPSKRGVERCEEITRYLVEKGCTIVSGGALGIDTVAHTTTVSASGRTVVVLGDPLRRDGKDERSRRILDFGRQDQVTTLTTYGPWISPPGTLFAARNQYVAAMADAVIVVEGFAKSGTLHTARYANQFGIPVWVFPGDLCDPFAGAANVLLEAGCARALVNFDTLARSIGLHKTPQRRVTKAHNSLIDTQGVSDEPLIKLLKKLGGRATLDEMCLQGNCSLTELQGQISYLEIMGFVRKIGPELVLARI